MPDPFDALVPQGTGELQTIRPGERRDPFDILQAGLERPYSGMTAFTHGYIHDVPVVGPPAATGLQNVAAGIRSYQSGKPYSEEQDIVRKYVERALMANPDLASAGGIAGNIATFGPIGATRAGAALLGGEGLPVLGNLGQNLLTRMGVGATTGGTIGAADAYMRGENPAAGGAIGAVTGGAAPVVGGVFRGFVSPFNTPRRTIEEEARQPLVNTLTGEGVRLPAGDITGNKQLRGFEDLLRYYPGVGRVAEEQSARAAQDLGEAALRRVNPNIAPGTRPTPDVLQREHTNLQGQYNAIAARTPVHTNSPDFINDVATARQNYLNAVIDPTSRDYNLLAYFRQLERLPVASGEEYQRLRTVLRQFAEGARTGPVGNKAGNPTSEAYDALRRALDAQFSRSATPQDADLIRQLNNRYTSLKIIEDAMTGTGAQTNKGFLTPAALDAAVLKRSGAYARGLGPDLIDLGRAAGGIMRPLPESGTGRQMIGAGIVATGGAAAGGALGLRDEDHPVAGGASGAGVGALAVPAFAYAAGRAALSPLGQRYLTNQWLSTPAAASLAAGLLSELSAPGRRPTLRQLGD